MLKTKRYCLLAFKAALFAFAGIAIYTATVCLPSYLAETLSELSWLDENYLICVFFLAGFMLMLYREMDKKHIFSFSRFVLSLAFSVIITINRCLLSEADFGRPPFGYFAIILAGNSGIFYCALTAFYNNLDKFIETQNNTEVKRSVTPHFYFFILLILWLPYVILTYPGNMTYDTGAAINHFMGFVDNVNNPYMQTFIFGSVYWIGEKLGNPNAAIAVYCILQMLLLCFIISRIISQFELWGLPIKYCIVLVLFLGLLPVFPLYALCMGKDSNFGICLLWFSYLLLCIITEEDISKKNVYGLAGTSIVLGLLRNGGNWISIISLGAVAIFLYGKKKKALCRTVLLTIIITQLVHILLPMAMRIPEGNISESFSIPLQQTGYYYTSFPEEITEEEYDAIYGVITEKGLNSYNPRNVDPIKNTYNNNASEETVREYFRTWYQMFKKHPVAYIKAAYFQTYCYYTPGTISSDIKPHCSIGYIVFPSVFKNTALVAQNPTGTAIATKINDAFTKLPVLGHFQKIGIYTWILLALLVFYLSKKQYKMIVPLIPSWIVIIACCFSPINGYFRYAFPMILSVVIIGAGTVVSVHYQKRIDRFNL